MRLAMLLLAVSLATPVAAADETPIPFFAQGDETCLGSGLRRPLAQGARTEEVTLVRKGAPDPLSEDAAWIRLREVQGLPVERRPESVWAAIRLRGEKQPRIAQLGCSESEGGSLGCSVDCDGGSVRVRQTPDGFAMENRGLRLSGACGTPGERYWWKDGPHDRDFRLTRLDGPACKRVIESMRPAHATGGDAILDRVAAGRTCARRSYDDAHLRRHPEQRVKMLTIEWKGFDAEDEGRGRLLVGLTSRSGEVASEMLACQPEGFALDCFPKKDDGTLTLTRGKGRTIRLAMQGSEGQMRKIGGFALGRQDDVFVLDEAPCGKQARE